MAPSIGSRHRLFLAGISLDLIQFKPVFPIVTEKIIKHLGVKWVNSEFSFCAQRFPIRNRTSFSPFQKERSKTRIASIILNKGSICWKLWRISIAKFYCSHDFTLCLKTIFVKWIYQKIMVMRYSVSDSLMVKYKLSIIVQKWFEFQNI